MRIEVTQKHINEGQRKECSRCPVALALKDAFPGKWAHAGPTTIFSGGKEWNTPNEVFLFMLRFDNGQHVFPFSFDLPIEEKQ